MVLLNYSCCVHSTSCIVSYSVLPGPTPNNMLAKIKQEFVINVHIHFAARRILSFILVTNVGGQYILWVFSAVVFILFSVGFVQLVSTHAIGMSHLVLDIYYWHLSAICLKALYYHGNQVVM